MSSMPEKPAPVPQRTADGQAELSRRERGLTQRQRTVLFLVDGRRRLDEILHLAEKAGADAECFDELVALGLVDRVDTAVDLSEVAALPPSLPLQNDSSWAPSDDPASDAANPLPRSDRPLDEARALLLRAVRSEAPVAGALTLLKLKRAASREALEALLDEVEQRLRKPHRQVIAAQTMRHVRHLLSLPSVSLPPLV